MYQAFVTISGMDEDTSWNYLEVSLKSPEYETFEEAKRWYDAVNVPRFGAVAMALHANNPDLIQIEAEYDIYCDGEPVYAGLFDDYFINEAIWY